MIRFFGRKNKDKDKAKKPQAPPTPAGEGGVSEQDASSSRLPAASPPTASPPTAGAPVASPPTAGPPTAGPSAAEAKTEPAKELTTAAAPSSGKPADKTAKSVGRLLRVSPRKLNLVAQSIRGLQVEKALNQLQFSSRRIAGAAKKILESAIANAENNHALNIDDLVVAEAYVGKNMVLRRWRPRARGRAAPVRKPFSQLTIIVKEAAAPPPKQTRKRRAAPKTKDKQDGPES